MVFRWMLAILLATTGALASADDGEPLPVRFGGPSYYFQIFGGQSMTILGSEDRRTGFGIGIAYGRKEPRFAIKGTDAELVFEAYYDRTSSRGASGEPPNSSDSYGLLAYARYRWPKKRGIGLYATAGWGLQFTDKTSVDLDSHINSTPMIGLGVSWDTGDGEGTVGLRFLHISNAGTVGNNQGQNQLFLVYSWRF